MPDIDDELRKKDFQIAVLKSLIRIESYANRIHKNQMHILSKLLDSDMKDVNNDFQERLNKSVFDTFDKFMENPDYSFQYQASLDEEIDKKVEEAFARKDSSKSTIFRWIND